ncbi:MAG: UDP-N-acetylmuramate dehydrogenase [Pseudomonadota bacterium]|nr:UDP-N-acetylmuramate dehydrogenase [Pseudomonadota bacterium]
MSRPPAIRDNVRLADLNTLAVDACARHFVEVHDESDVRSVLTWAESQKLDTLILGGGSNLVFAGDFPGLVVLVAIKGRCWEQVSETDAILRLGAGENWHEAVLYAARSGYRGIENLALIPGTAGAAPVQNIGAYGTELCDTLVSVDALDRHTGERVCLSVEQCQFAYRDSLFKHHPGRYLILEIRLRLSRQRPLNLGYRDLQEYLGHEVDFATLTPLQVAEAVMAVRRRKLPDPAVLPNAGSFFKNPVISRNAFDQLSTRYPDVVAYPQPEGVKLAAAWLIDQAGWKGFRNEHVGVHNRQALVLVNHGHGAGQDVLDLASRIQASVQETFGVSLEMEPGIVGG